jgi:hypothetical protein
MRFLPWFSLLAICFVRKSRKIPTRMLKTRYTLYLPLCFFNSMASVLGVFFVTAIVANAADNFFGVVTTR